jgi:hypothetical protein
MGNGDLLFTLVTMGGLAAIGTQVARIIAVVYGKKAKGQIARTQIGTRIWGTVDSAVSYMIPASKISDASQSISKLPIGSQGEVILEMHVGNVSATAESAFVSLDRAFKDQRPLRKIPSQEG